MTAHDLATSDMRKARVRRKALDLYFTEESWSDVVSEAQEMVELVLKGILRFAGIEPPKYHDVGPVLIEYGEKLTQYSPNQLARAAEISLRLRREREAAFYGDVDLIPSDVFKREDALRAIDEPDEILRLTDAAFGNTIEM